MTLRAQQKAALDQLAYAAIIGEEMSIAGKFGPRDRRQLSIIGAMLHQEPTEEEAEQERLFDLLEKAAKLKDIIRPQIQGKSSPDDQGSS